VRSLIESEGASKLESRIIHHDILVRVEDQLFKFGAALDLNVAFAASEPTADIIHGAIGKVAYVRAEGSAVIEDYNNITAILERFNDLVSSWLDRLFRGRKLHRSLSSKPDGWTRRGLKYETLLTRIALRP
jgi:hypothetical protein